MPSTADTVKETFEALAGILGSDKAPFLFDARVWPSGDADSWVAFINRIPEFCTAGAIVVDTADPPQLGFFPEALSRLLIPFSVFADEVTATEFLLEVERMRQTDQSGGV